MRYLSSILFVVLSLLSSCTEVLREPALSIKDVATKAEPIDYNIKEVDVSPAVVASANKTPFVRYVNAGLSQTGPVTKVQETELFSGKQMPTSDSNRYLIEAGDAISVSRSGFEKSVEGILTRSVVNQRYIVDEDGLVNLVEGPRVLVKGSTIVEARLKIANAIKSSYETKTVKTQQGIFPTQLPPTYKLGNGDVISVTRLIETVDSDGSLRQSIQRSQSTVGSDGLVSILELGEIAAKGLSLSQVRDRVQQEALRNSAGVDTVIEIAEFNSQSVLVTGDLGTQRVPITSNPLSYRDILVILDPTLSSGKDYTLTLERNGRSYQMTANSLLLSKESGSFFSFSDDILQITEIRPDITINVDLANPEPKRATYLRVRSEDTINIQKGQLITFDIKGIDLRQLLVSQGIDINQNKDLMVSVYRDGEKFNLSAQKVVFGSPRRKYWLRNGDVVIVQDLAYVGEKALIVGEVAKPKKVVVDRYTRTTVSEALFASGVFSTEAADFKHIYVLRGKGLDYKAYHFDITQILNLSLAEEFELRPSDIVFVRTRPLTRYTNAIITSLRFLNAVNESIVNTRTFGQ